jgi:hypothetical protein
MRTKKLTRAQRERRAERVTPKRPRDVADDGSDADPFGPPSTPIEVQCLHCGSEYLSDAMVQDDEGLWCCGVPGCDGRGFEFDVWPVGDDLPRLG